MVDNVPRNYSERAEEMRAIADGMRDEGSRRMLLELAERYDKMEADRKARSAREALRAAGYSRNTD
ncbi:MAG TPA: hypothetical protein VL966_06685 [Alphaproteobacteria bacterium]|jgi:hypothetical protein|nr:hypothetical protein [Alphaproteobacteria bacterium]